MTLLQAGQMLGPYRIIEQIGKGGMATVYKAYHPAMDRYVAIKILPFQFAQNEEFLERFRREVKVIARLEHPHILPVYDSGEFQDTPYLVMRYLEAGTLKDRIQERELTLEEIDRLLTQLTESLGYAHSLDVIHRDIKPSNVLITNRGDIFLTDFGIAKMVDETTAFTASGAITGTPAYMSPEQAEGRKLDPRTDIYSLGIVLYEMVTGRVPYEAETPLAVILKHLQDPLPLPTTIQPDIHPAIERILLKALAKDRDDRYSTTAELLASWKAAFKQAQSEAPTAHAVVAPTAPSVVPETTPEQPPLVSPMPTEPPAITPAAEPPKRGLPVLAIIGGIILFVAILVGAILIFRPGPTSRAEPTPISSDEVSRPTSPSESDPEEPVGDIVPQPGDRPGEEPQLPLVEPGVPFPPDGFRFDSWTGANFITTVEARGDVIFSGGLGGITIFNREGELLEHWTVQQGLPDNRVSDIFFDDEGDGSIWIGTSDGLVRILGDEWIYYGYEDGLDSTIINTIDRIDEFIVVGTSYGGDGGGINIFDGDSWFPIPNFDSADEFAPNRFSNQVTSFAINPFGDLFVGTANGLGAFDGENWLRITEAEGLPSNEVLHVAFDQDGRLVVATANGLVVDSEDGLRPFPQLEGVLIHDMLQQENGVSWFAGEGGVWRFDPRVRDWEHFGPENNRFPAWGVLSVDLNDDGSLYFGTDGEGVIRIHPETQDFSRLFIEGSPRQSASWIILEGPGGMLWFHEEYGCMFDTFQPRTGEWRPVFPPIESCPFPLTIDQDGGMWLGGDTGLWNLHLPNEKVNFSTRNGLPDDYVTDVAFSPEGIWVATGDGLALMRGDVVVEVFFADQIGAFSNEFELLLFARDGSLWAATSEMELLRRHPSGDWEHFTVGNPFSDAFYGVYDLAEDRIGGIWVATSGDGAYRFFDGHWAHFAPHDPGVGLPSFEVNDVSVAPDGSVWFGTDNGAARYDGEGWSHFNEENGIAHWNVNEVYVDKGGAVWFATSGGISRFGP